MIYSHRAVEKKWRIFFQEKKLFKTLPINNKKAYILDMFPYPSGAGLHLGHLKGYIATDTIARFRRSQGYAVLHPIGWDAFGLPAEQFALQTKRNPVDFTMENINTFRLQLQALGFMFDEDKEINTTDPKYYQWTQWIFIQLYKKGLVELKKVDVNWCEELKIVLANEEVVVVDGQMVSERGHYLVTKKPMQQWVLKITKYADKLLKGLDNLDWPESVKELQRNWIGATKGFLVDWQLKDSWQKITIFTTKIATIFGVSAIVLSTKHPLVNDITIIQQQKAMNTYLEKVRSKTDLERKITQTDKSGVFTGSYVIHPLTNELIPVWVADYVLSDFATKAIMLVPAHNYDDYLFAIKFNLDIKVVMRSNDNNETLPIIIEDGIYINSQFLDGLEHILATKKVLEVLKEKHLVKEHTAYRLRDWLFSRQRYWGEPFPIIFWEDNTIGLVDEKELPVILPFTNNIKPSSTGKSPLANIKSWVNVIRSDKVKGQRDTNTMPQWAGSCWYYLAYILKQSDGSYLPLNSKVAYKALQDWLPVDLYIGGQEHAVLHLLYARFWHQVLYDLKIVPTAEPFQKLINQGMILGNDGEKMSKSKNNGVSPNEIIMSHGADALRVYEVFMGPVTASMAWNIQGLDGCRKWLDRVYRLVSEHSQWFSNDNDGSLDYIYHFTIAKVTKDLENLSLNTIISQLMIFINNCYQTKKIYLPYFLGFIKVLSLFAVFLAEELWSLLKQEKTAFEQSWPIYEEKFLITEKITFIIQINGRLAKQLLVVPDLSQDKILSLLQEDENFQNKLSMYQIKKTIFVMNKILNFVVDKR